MDHDSHFQDGVDAERMRMSSFTFGKPIAPSGANLPSRHSRSHSRNSSVSVPPPSLPTSISATPMNDSRSQSPTRNSISGAKRNSHHRRRSSVSTRRESADLMGVSLPSIPTSSSEDNINLGDKDSIRRRALWALEGKDVRGTFSVEIPELDTPEAPKRSFDFPTKPSFPPGIGAGYSGGLNTLMGSKRDSIKLMASPSSSEMLGTLVEEEEEEDEEEPKAVATSPEKHVSVPTTVTEASAPARPRPASLNLRPLSLSSNSLFQADVLTPSPTPSPRPGLKSLTLASSPSSTIGSTMNRRQSVMLSSSPSSPAPLNRRPPLNVTTDNAAVASPNRRSSISYLSNADAQTVSVWGLPTPDMTPTSSTLDKRRNTSVSSAGSMDLSQLNMQRGRPLSMSEQHFLFQAHETLVQRITDLERALAHSSRSRPVSCASDTSYASSNPSEPSDEMLQLIADLKAERDELKKDVDGWRTRVADLQRQIDMHAMRIETERRDAWVARQRVGLLEVEKSALEKTIVEKTAQADDALARLAASNATLQSSQNEVTHLKAEVERLRDVEDECARLRAELLAERKKREEMERDLEHAGLLDTPRPFNAISNGVPAARVIVHAKRGLGFRSIDSESSFTDVESGDEDHRPGLKAVQEVDEDDSETTSDEEDDELARYEDEEEGDEYEFPTSMSYESVMEYSRATTPRLSTDSANSAPSLCTSRSPSVSPSPLPSPMEPVPTPAPAHARRASLSKAWTFPAGPTAVPAAERPFEEIDHFFGCLEDVDNSPPMDSMLHSVESSKNIFAQALIEDDDDLPPFVIPSDVGSVVVSPEFEAPQRSLDIVVEEDEETEEDEDEAQQYDDYDIDEEFVGEVDEGGIKFTFNPPPEYCLDSDADTSASVSDLSIASPTSPTFQFANKSDNVFEPVDESEEDVSFTFPQVKSKRNSTLPSAIPRLRSPSPSMLPLPISSSTPPKIVAPVPRRATMSPTSFSTPPLRRSATAPTFIPQPRSSPSTPSKLPKAAPFIPQPQRAPTSPKPSAIPIMTSSPASTGTASRSPSVTPRPPSTAQNMKTSYASAQPQLASPPSPSSSAPAPYSPSLPSLMSPTFMSPTFSARLSFQTLANFIPVPSMLWSSRTSEGCSDLTASTSASARAAEHSRTDSSFVNATVPIVRKSEAPKERTCVPKEKQLERLRLRMEEERKRGRPTGSSLGVQVKKSETRVFDI